MCEQCETTTEKFDALDFVDEEGPQPTEEMVGIAAVQRGDLETLKRIRLLQAQVQHHQNMLRAAVESLVGMTALLSDSVSPLLVGGMPDWFTASVFEANDLFTDLAESLTEVADRLENDYTG